jgi:hypothetical protein
VAHHQYAGIDHGPDLPGHAAPTLAFHRVASGFLDEAQGVQYGIPLTRFVGTLRHIADEKGVRCPPMGGFGEYDHLVHGHRVGGRVPQLDHASGIAYQDQLDSGPLGRKGKREVVSSHPRRRGMLRLHARQTR